MKNLEVRVLLLEKNIKNYQVAEKLGMSDSTFSIMLRKDMSEAQKSKIMQAIEELRK